MQLQNFFQVGKKSISHIMNKGDKNNKHLPGGSTLKTRTCRKSSLHGFARSSEDTDHGNGGKHAKTCKENGLESISFSINTTCHIQTLNIYHIHLNLFLSHSGSCEISTYLTFSISITYFSNSTHIMTRRISW